MTKTTKSQKSLISILADNKKGMLAKFAKFFADNNMNIESLTLSQADIANKIHRTTASITGDRNKVDKICKGLEEIEGVHKVINFMADSFIERELGLVKIKVTDPTLAQITGLVNEYKGKIIHSDLKIIVYQVEEIEEKISTFMEKMKKLTNEVEILRTGIVATSLEDKIN